MGSARTDALVAWTRIATARVRRDPSGVQSLSAGLTLAVVIVWLAWDGGGYFADSYLRAGAIVYAALTLVLLLGTPQFAVSSPALVALAALASLTAWTGLSVRWSLSPHGAVQATQRDLVYTGLFALALIAVGSGRGVRPILWGSLAAISAIVGTGVLSRLYPDLIGGAAPQIFGAPVYRLSYPLGYWNAFGGLAAMGALTASGLAADASVRTWLRALSAGAAAVMALATYLSFSRGAAVALLVGVIVLALLTSNRGSLLTMLAVVGGGAALAIARLETYPALTETTTRHPGQRSAGHAFAPELLAIVVAVSLLSGFFMARSAKERAASIMRARRKPLRVVVAAIAAAATLTGIARAGEVGDGLADAGRATAHRWESFWSTNNKAVAPQSGLGRFASTDGTRGELYSVAIDGFTAHPLIGDGAGSFEIRWLRQRPSQENDRNAHSLEIETLGEEGAIGGALLLLLIGAVVAAALRGRGRGRGHGRGRGRGRGRGGDRGRMRAPGRGLGLRRAEAAAVSAALAVWLVHSAVDWDWQMTAVTAIALVLASTLMPARGDELG